MLASDTPDNRARPVASWGYCRVTTIERMILNLLVLKCGQKRRTLLSEQTPPNKNQESKHCIYFPLFHKGF